jgi:hypothetical protein
MSDYSVIIKGATTKDDGWEEPLPGNAWEHSQEGKCPDCGGKWVWAEAGNVPGTRECQDCHSLFSVQAHMSAWYLRRERIY